LVAPRCEPDAPVGVLIIHGTKDGLVPYAGGPGGAGRDDRIDPPVSEAVAFWTRHNGGAADVVLHAIEGGRHQWPDEATDMIWTFFAARRKPSS
jgi:polyhydroxybutyrate depolymerase